MQAHDHMLDYNDTITVEQCFPHFRRELLCGEWQLDVVLRFKPRSSQLFLDLLRPSGDEHHGHIRPTPQTAHELNSINGMV